VAPEPVVVAELAEDWLTAKRALESAVQAAKGNSDRARRSDLERWGSVIAEVRGRSPSAEQPTVVLLTLGDLSEEVLVGAMAVAKGRWSDATVARMLSTLRGFTRWAHRRGYLAEDPLDTELFQAPPRAQRRPRALEDEDVESVLAAAGDEPRGRQRMFWQARDVALVRFLASTGARAEEVCGVTIGEVDRRAERPIWRVGRSKGGKTRDVPLPRGTVDAIDQWLAERARPPEGRRALAARPADLLFVRPDGSALSPQALDRLVRGPAGRAGVVLPAGAAAHAFRHHYGVTLALRGVPGNVISQLMGHADPRTTSIYTNPKILHLTRGVLVRTSSE
jgi:site-specific recombinase XerD